MKAYSVWVDDSDKGTSVVFAENAKEAKKIAFSYAHSCEDERWIDIRVKRLPKADNLYRGYSIGDWYDMDLREVLVKEYGWFCIWLDDEECKVCRLCEEVE